MSANGNIPPHNQEAEESIIGSVLISPAALEACSEIIKPSDFYRPSHGLIFLTALKMAERGEAVDAITLANELEQRGELDKAGGRAKLAELSYLVPATANAPHYARIVKETAALRGLIAAGTQIARLGWDRPGELDDLMAQAESLLTGAVSPTITSQFSPLADELGELVEEIEEAMRSGKPKIGLPTGFLDLDKKLTGMHPGQLILIAARPAMGKSALAQNAAENVADGGVPVGYVSLEMSKRELLIRSLSRASNIDSSRLRTGQIKQEEAEKFQRAQLSVTQRRDFLHVEDRSDITPQQLRAEARRLHRQKKIGLLVVDYLQLMQTGSTPESRQQEIAAISRSLKVLARELNIPIVALSQLSRALEMRQEKRPQLSDLRDSGALEQDADVVLFIYRDDYYNNDSANQGIAEVIISKNRMGAPGTVKLAFSGRGTAFKNLAQGVTQ